MTFRKVVTYSMMYALLAAPGWAQEVGKSKAKTAAEVFDEMSFQGVTHDLTPVTVHNAVEGYSNYITYGAEKEGIDFAIANVKGPKASKFKKFVDSLDFIGTKNKQLFLRDFLAGMQSGDFAENSVIDVKGTERGIDYSKVFSGKNVHSMTEFEIVEAWEKWLAQTGDKPFSHIKPVIRQMILNGGLEGNQTAKARKVLAGSYKSWEPLFGLAEKYIGKSEPAADYIHRMAGYEIQSTVMKSYGDFKNYLEWFTTVMKQADPDEKMSKTPGQMRVVWPQIQLDKKGKKNYEAKTAELFKMLQAYIVYSDILKHPGIMHGKWKDILKDSQIASLQTSKGPLRMEYGRWPKNLSRHDTNLWNEKTGAVELRAGVKVASTQDFLHRTLVSYVSTNDWGRLQDGDSWKLVPNSLTNLESDANIFAKDGALDQIAQRFSIQKSVVKKFFEVIKSKKTEVKGGFERRIDVSYLIPLWHWDRAPFLSETKKKILAEVTRDFVTFISKKGNKLTFEEMEKAIQSWAKTANIDKDIEDYLLPRRSINNGGVSELEFHAQSAPKEGDVDVNKIDTGIEYTARLPINSMGKLSEDQEGEGEEKAANGKSTWVNGKLGLTPTERTEVIYGLAQNLRKNLGIPATYKIKRAEAAPKKEEEGKKEKSHGHGISLSFSFENPKELGGGEYRVEWDGIGRSYAPNGEIIPGSTRGGHIELVTPRGVLQQGQVEAIFKSFQESSVVPGKVGGGHINVDLKPFEGKPAAMARFLAMFHKHRAVMSTMFQLPGRMKTSEPVQLSKEFNDKLKNFKGTESELKELLYNNTYFNDRLGRKSRYVQLDMSSYFQDVIPAEFISQDFDINNPTELWHQQFRVKPHIRKMEFRMMDAPRTAFESAKQLQLVRAMLHRALNDETPVVGDFQDVKHELYTQNPKIAFDELKAMTDELGLNYEDYKGFMAERIESLKTSMKSKFYKTFAEKVKDNPHVTGVWGQAVPARSATDANLPHSDIPWKNAEGKTLTEPLQIALDFKEKRFQQAHADLAKRVAEAEKSLALQKANKVDPSELCFQRTSPEFGVDLAKVIKDFKPLLQQ